MITITLPGGGTAVFAPTLGSVQDAPDNGIPLTLQPCYLNEGTLTCSYSASSTLYLGVSDIGDTWDSHPFSLTVDPEDDTPFAPDTFNYATTAGTLYQFFLINGGPTWGLRQIIDANSNSVTYYYDALNRLIAMQHSCGKSIQFNYATNASGTWINVSDSVQAAGNLSGGTSSTNYAVRYFVQGNPTNGLLTEVDKLVDRVLGTYEITTYSYGTNANPNCNRLTQVFDGRGIMTVSNVYSPANDGTLSNQFDALLRTSAYSYNPTNQTQLVTKTVSGTNQTVTVNYTSSGAVGAVLQPITAPGYLGTAYTYDSKGNVTAQTDSYGNTQSTGYDYLNRPISQSDALGNSTSVQLNVMGQPTLSTDANGNGTTNVYDQSNGNLLQSQDPTGSQSSMTYAPVIMGINGVAAGGLVASSTQQSPGVSYPVTTSYTYYPGSGQPQPNSSGEVASMTQQWPSGSGMPVSTTSYTYDANGNRTSETTTATVNGVPNTPIVTQYQYDAENRLVATIDPIGRTNTTIYDHAGHPYITTDVDNRSTTNTYDAAGNLIETAYPDGTVSRMTYDELNHVLYTQDRSVPGTGGATTNAASLNVYDGAGRVVCMERLSGVILAKAINSSLITRSGADTIYGMTNTAAGTLVSFTRTVYDLAGRVQYSMAANGNVTQYNYDAAGRRTNVLVYTNYTVNLSSINQTIAPTGGTNSTQYFYDPNGNQIEMIDAKTNKTDYLYDTANRLILTTYPVLADGTRHQTAIAYDGAGNKIGTTDEAGVKTAYTYDYRGLLTSVILDTASSGQLTYQYTYDERGNQLSQSDANGNLTQYEYDALSRRTARILPDGSTEITAYADVPLTNGSSINVQQTSVTDFRGKTIVTTEDVMGRMATKSLPPINAGETNTVETYTYTAGGQRSSVTVKVGGVTTQSYSYNYDGLNRLTQKASMYDLEELSYTWTPDNHILSISGFLTVPITTNGPATNSSTADVSLEYAYDYLGRLAFVTNSTISSPNVTSYTYDAVGNEANLLNSTDSTISNYRYTGQQWDPDLQQYYLRARNYDPKLGRFWTMDTDEGDNEGPLSLHKYIYCQADPVNMTDLSGFAASSTSGNSPAAIFGKAVEKVIMADFRRKFGELNGLTGKSILRALKLLGKARLIEQALPDLVNVEQKSVFEIKPGNAKGLLAGAAQLAGYMVVFKAIDPQGGWHVGSAAEYTPPLSFTVPVPPFFVVVTPPVLGLITYNSLQSVSQKFASSTTRAQGADIEDSEGIAAETAEEGAP